MADFRKLVLGFVERKLGPGDRSKLVSNIMDVADVNKDAKVTFKYKQSYCKSTKLGQN